MHAKVRWLYLSQSDLQEKDQRLLKKNMMEVNQFLIKTRKEKGWNRNERGLHANRREGLKWWSEKRERWNETGVRERKRERKRKREREKKKERKKESHYVDIYLSIFLFLVKGRKNNIYTDFNLRVIVFKSAN